MIFRLHVFLVQPLPASKVAVAPALSFFLSLPSNTLSPRPTCVRTAGYYAVSTLGAGMGVVHSMYYEPEVSVSGVA